MISCSSSTASSQPATSAKVTLGLSLLASLARDLPNCMTRLPPPCIWPMRNQKRPRMIRIGTMLKSSEPNQLGWSIWSVKPFLGATLLRASTISVPRAST